jgi:hypothetical protein
MSDHTADWMPARIDALDELLRRHDYRGWDPFDLTNSPLLPVPENWRWSQLALSKFGSRLAPAWLRRALRVPLIEDPKTYACAYFAYRAQGDAESAGEMGDRLARLASPAWGYDFTWPTRTSGVNKRGSSTIVPGSFAIFALADDLARSGPRHRQLLTDAVEHYAVHHRSVGPRGEFLSYFVGGGVNTHNANLLGCTALSVSAALLGRDDWHELAARCANTTLAAVGADGYLPYAEHDAGDWTDCFHHLYVMACLLALARVNPSSDADRLEGVVDRMRAYLRREFLRADGLLNYYPGKLYPIDPHNYAAAAIYAALFGTASDLSPERGEELLAAVDQRMWDEAKRLYLFRRYRHRLDRRYFVRWTQAWMFAALAITAAHGFSGLVPTGPQCQETDACASG